ncbi:MAG: permease prefix domain 2-containing transporter [Bacteroidota bacterium]
MKQEKPQPARLAMACFRWFCRPAFREEIEGDLLERFHDHVERYGQVKANRRFVLDVILLFRPALVGNIYQLTNTDTMVITKQNQRLFGIVITATVLLFIPLVAMLFTEEVNWNIADFLVAGILLIGAGLFLELILRTIQTKRNRMLLIVTLFLCLLLIWAELAVGIFGTIFAGS